MSQIKPIHLAKSIQNLEIIAGKYSKRLNKIDKLCDCADKVYLRSKEEPDDEEKTFIYLLRYSRLMDDIYRLTGDAKFVQSRFGSKVRWCEEQLSIVRKNLINRYNEINASQDEPVDKIERPSSNGQQVEIEVVETPQKLFSQELFALSQEVYNLYVKQNCKMLIVDIRPESEYNLSHLKDISNLNVPENFVKPGLSAKKLEQNLPDEIQERFKNRASYDILILMDWNTSSQTYPMSKLQVLHNIITIWEYKVTYKYKPVILDGGYLSWIEKYPTLSTNSHVIYNKKYSDLDELLDLDNIQYPTDITNTTMSLEIKEQKPEFVAEPTPTRDTLLSKLQKVALKQLENERDLLNTQKRFAEINKLIQEASDTTNITNYKKEISDLENTVSKLESIKIQLDERKNKLNTEFSLNASFVPGSDQSTQEKMKEIDMLEEEIVQTFKKRKTFQALEHVPEQKEVDVSGDENKSSGKVTHPPTRPVVDRKRKPTTMNYLPGTVKFVSNGLTGLENIRNTCYMNSLIQCMRHLPPVYTFYCNGSYRLHVKEKDLSITVEFAELVRCLWMNSHTVIRPAKFYNRLRTLEPMYGEGQHECVHMFFLFLLDSLHEDAQTDMNEANNNISRTRVAWLIKFKGKFSFYLKNFYHQIQETQLCFKCGKKAVRFQSEPTLMVAVPEKSNFTLEDVLQDYFTQDCKYCTKCKVQCKITKMFSYCPPIVTVVLKRYHQKGSRFYRNNNACYFKVDNLILGSQKYKLHAIALHQGTLNSGHYTAACLNPTDNKWYEFNDDIVKPMDITDDKVKVKAYVLFYVAESWQNVPN